MPNYSKKAITDLGAHLGVEAEFIYDCLRVSVIELRESNGRLQLDNGTTLHLRRVERICRTFEVDVPTALLLRESRRK